MRWTPLGENAVVVEFGDRIDREILHRVWNFGRVLDRSPPRGMLEYVPGCTTVALLFDPLMTDVAAIGAEVERIGERLVEEVGGGFRTVEIPVCYGEEFGSDLEFVARHNGISQEEVIRLHAGGEYFVMMIGFAPGFPYLGGMSPRIAAPRLASPRLKVPAGSVGIAGDQTGIYPLATPGGWRLIGRTPVALFRPSDRPPSLLQAGDSVRFRSIRYEEYRAWTEGHPCRSR